MLKKYMLFTFSIFYFLSISASQSGYSIVLVHIGDTLPVYIEACVQQIRTFNECDIFLISNKRAFEERHPYLDRYNVICVTCESLQKSPAHASFLKRTPIGKNWVRFATERFFYLQEITIQYNLKNVFHMEYDNMLYVNLADHLIHFENNYSIGATFDNDMRCIPGFLYIKNAPAINALAEYLAYIAPTGKNDMETLALFRTEKGFSKIDHLPILTKEYGAKNKLISPEGYTGAHAPDYCKNIDLFNSIFDAAALGQYLGGIDPKNGPSMPGFINESCVFNPSLMRYEWVSDAKGRAIPYIHYANKKYRINNLHIHSKRLHQFLSLK